MTKAKERLLIVDDEPGITSAAAEIGLETLAIHNSDQFEKALQIAIPGRDGMQLVGRLASDNYPGKIVIISGSDQFYIHMLSDVAKTRGLIVAGALQKPFGKQAVVNLLKGLAEPPP